MWPANQKKPLSAALFHYLRKFSASRSLNNKYLKKEVKGLSWSMHKDLVYQGLPVNIHSFPITDLSDTGDVFFAGSLATSIEVLLKHLFICVWGNLSTKKVFKNTNRVLVSPKVIFMLAFIGYLSAWWCTMTYVIYCTHQYETKRHSKNFPIILQPSKPCLCKMSFQERNKSMSYTNSPEAAIK